MRRWQQEVVNSYTKVKYGRETCLKVTLTEKDGPPQKVAYIVFHLKG
jgi:hypothetical protein